MAACVAGDVIWRDPALPEPARGRLEVAEFVRRAGRTFPDLSFSEPGPLASANDGLAVYPPWVMSGANTGPIDPPGFAATGKRIEITGVDIWQFRGDLIWRCVAIYDFTDLGG